MSLTREYSSKSGTSSKSSLYRNVFYPMSLLLVFLCVHTTIFYKNLKF